MTPDETEIWVTDGHNEHLHVFNATVMPPKQVASIKVRKQLGWITFSIDGKTCWSSTGDVIDTATRKIIHTLTDEEGRILTAPHPLLRMCYSSRTTSIADNVASR